MDFFLWVYLKTSTYANRPDNRENLMFEYCGGSNMFHLSKLGNGYDGKVLTLNRHTEFFNKNRINRKNSFSRKPLS